MFLPCCLFLFRTSLRLILVSSLLVGCTANELVSRRNRGDVFRYRGDTYVMDDYAKLFGKNQLGETRRVLFESYLANSTEGKARRRVSSSGTAREVWTTLTREEQATFLSITAALATLTTNGGSNVLHWIASLNEIHGEQAFLDDREFKNNEAFRLYATLAPESVNHLEAAKESFVSSCFEADLGYDGSGSKHPDFCRITGDFDAERKTDNHPNLQFNYSPESRCTDIDIDYRRGFQHLARDNSNILANKQVLKFNKQYCDPGFRLKP